MSFDGVHVYSYHPHITYFVVRLACYTVCSLLFMLLLYLYWYTGVPQGSILGPLLFNICINDIIIGSDKLNFILYADDTTLNATVESFGETAADIQLSISNEIQKICKWLDLNKLHLNVAKSKFMILPCLRK